VLDGDRALLKLGVSASRFAPTDSADPNDIPYQFVGFFKLFLNIAM